MDVQRAPRVCDTTLNFSYQCSGRFVSCAVIDGAHYGDASQFGVEMADLNAIRREILEEYAAPHCHPWVIGFSGGKDSTLVTHLVFEFLLSIPRSKRVRPVHVVANDTLVESPLVVSHLRRVTVEIQEAAQAFDLPVTVAITSPKPDKSFWVNIEVPIGEVSAEVTTKLQIEWLLNGPGGSPHSALMGGVGSGKTRTAVAMLKAIRARSQAPFIAFDFKGDLTTDSEGKGYGLEKVFDATVIQPPRQPIPLDVLALVARDSFSISEAAVRFRESFSRLKGSSLGAKQRPAVAEAVENALQAYEPCELRHIRDALKLVYENKGMPEDGATAALEDICRFPLFAPIMPPREFFKRSWVIRLPQEVPEVCRSIVVNLTLDALDTHLNSLPDSPMPDGKHRSLRALCVIDEAHRILGTKLPSLGNLIRMSRSKGGAVMLISQSPDDFQGEDDDFLSEMGLIGAFATNAKPNAINRIFGRGANLSKLATGQCITKLRGEDSARRVLAWVPNG